MSVGGRAAPKLKGQKRGIFGVSFFNAINIPFVPRTLKPKYTLATT